MLIVRRFKKSAVGATDVTLVPTTLAEAGSRPEDLPISQIVIDTNAAAPPPEFWGTAADGIEYEITISRKT